ncbi:MAG: bifunctional oligoribonuclease/PAP phosphatase NrnA [Anaerolineae bacterium]|nr:MAG: bifunctional oligoribonuclease/PAP phosphatase NrnA [Anaerolineae bacterium]
MTTEVERAAGLIAGSSEIVVISHERPDGDAVGSMLALTLAMQEIGKQVWPVLAGGLPPKWQFLPGADRVRRELPVGGKLIVTVDAADIRRLGPLDVKRVDLNFDHHPSNTQFGKINLVDPGAASTTVVLYRVFPQLKLPLEVDIASNLLLGLITDTLGFRTSSVSSDSLRIAAELIELGADISKLYRKALLGRSYEAVRYWAQGLSRMDMRDDVVWTVLRVSDRELAGYPGSDDADLIDVLTTIKGPRVAILFVEQPEGQVKISWRALPGVDVSRLAGNFDGGGHELAAGAMIEGEVQEVVERVLKATFATIIEADS